MKKILRRILLLSFILSLLIPATAYAKTAFREASVVKFEGTVKIQISGGQKKYTPYKGMGLTQGDTIITSNNASIILNIDDDKEITLGENSRLTLSELPKYIDSQSESTGLRLWAGKVFISIKKKLNIRSKFEIKTGSTVMGVKGTIFYIDYGRGLRRVDSNAIGNQNQGASAATGFSTTIAVLEGTVSTSVAVPVPNTGGQVLFQRKTFDIGANEMANFTDSIESISNIQRNAISLEDLDLFVLKAIRENPRGINPNLLEGIDGRINELEQQQQADQESETERFLRELSELIKSIQNMFTEAGRSTSSTQTPPSPPIAPSVAPPIAPSVAPPIAPSVAPSIAPSVAPSIVPSVAPTTTPSSIPTVIPSTTPTEAPTPIVVPSTTPTEAPTPTPIVVPSTTPTEAPTPTPIVVPSITPTATPSPTPTIEPSVSPIPAITINDINDITVIKGQTASSTVTVYPQGANLVVEGSDSAIATISVVGNTISATGVSPGAITVYVTATLSGYTPVTKTFTVNVIPSDQGNETVSISAPSNNDILKIVQGLTISGTATNNDDDLKSVKAAIKNNQTGLYLSGIQGDFTNVQPVYLDTQGTPENWNLNLSGTAFTESKEVECTVTVIANDGMDGQPAEITFKIDNKAPILISGSIPNALYSSGNAGNSVTFEFSEQLTSGSKLNVEAAINTAAISGDTSFLEFIWNDDKVANKYTLTVTNKATTDTIRFRDTVEVTAQVSDALNNNGTVTLLSFNPLLGEVTPTNVHLAIIDGEYVSYVKKFTITLPSGYNFVENLSAYPISDYVTLGGVFSGINDIKMMNVQQSTNTADLYFYYSDESDHYKMNDKGEGTIIISKQLWDGTAPLKVSINNTATVDDLSVTSDTIGEAILTWSQYYGTDTENITIYQCDTSQNGVFSPVPTDNIIRDGNFARISGLTPGKQYWFKLVITSGLRIGDSNTVNIIIPTTNASLGTMQNMTLTEGTNASQMLVVDPTDALITAQTDDAGIASVEVSGNTIKVYGNYQGSATVTVTISKEGYTTVKGYISVTVLPT